MLNEITQWDVEPMESLFGGLREHLAVESVLNEAAIGRVWVDSMPAPGTPPKAGVVWVQHRVFVAGEDWTGLNGVLREIAAAARARGDWGVGVYGADGEGWGRVLDGIVWRKMEREYWEIGIEEWQPPETWIRRNGLRLRAVDAALLAEVGLGRMEQLREEMCSERVSVEDFLTRSFGVCLVDEGHGSLAGWCLSEYNCGGRCEVGIEVVEGVRQRGFGTLLAQALCAEAFGQREMARVGWHCLAANEASRATARRAGLRLVKRYESVVALVGES